MAIEKKEKREYLQHHEHMLLKDLHTNIALENGRYVPLELMK
jgi:hypothetical protein